LYDIGIAPLAQEYDMRRSWIKVAEYMSMGIPFVATDTAPYHNPRVRHACRTGYFVDQGDNADKANEQDWYRALTTMISKMPEMKKKAEIDMEEHYESFLIDNNVGSIIQIYQIIVALEKGLL
jgi:glycosyltransferase involved in cell wall biosynthesis